MDTIVALATPSGRSAIGVIRLSGPDSLEITRSLIGENQFTPRPAEVALKRIRARSNDVLDTALVTYFQAPNSYTGEDIVELSCHGAPVVLGGVIDLILTLGARPADAGEFTLRALRNGKMNLIQAEGIRDLINAQTLAAARQAVRQLKGELSARLQTSEKKLLRIIVPLESALEFVEDDLPDIGRHALSDSVLELVDELKNLSATFRVGHILRDGVKVTIVGRPNVGKSSLFNRLLGHARAIVTEIPGTTRDTIAEPIGLDGVPISLIDTAGIRAATERIESIGVDRTRRVAADADLLIVVVDGSEPLNEEDAVVFTDVADKLHILAVNKSDLSNYSTAQFSDQASDRDPNRVTTLAVSAITEAGLADLRAAILKPFVNGSDASEGLLITNARHHDLLLRCVSAIGSSEQLVRQRASEELILVGLHNALRYLGEITGETTTEDILGQIFATFCIGK
jgi:tRNA modification GTPase